MMTSMSQMTPVADMSSQSTTEDELSDFVVLCSLPVGPLQLYDNPVWYSMVFLEVLCGPLWS